MNEEEARATLLELIHNRLEEHRRVEERDVDEGEVLELNDNAFLKFSRVLRWNIREGASKQAPLQS